MDVGFEIVIPDLILATEAPNMIGDVGPGAKSVDLGSLEEKQLLIGPPFCIEDGKRVLFNNPKGVRRRIVCVSTLALGKARDAEIEVGAC